MTTAREKLTNKIARMDDELILTCIAQIGGGRVDTEKSLVRALLIDEVERRHGEDAADDIMDRIGL